MRGKGEERSRMGEKAEQNVVAPPIAGMSFEEALGELEAIVQELERGQLDLDSAISAYERGTELRQHCAAKLKEAELRVEKLTLDRAGSPKLTPFDQP
jgi:exodeoxyribonuclease VII small subunit